MFYAPLSLWDVFFILIALYVINHYYSKNKEKKRKIAEFAMLRLLDE